MKRYLSILTVGCAAALLSLSVAAQQDEPPPEAPATPEEPLFIPPDPFAKEPTLKVADSGKVKADVLKWLRDQKADDATVKAAEALWENVGASGDELLDAFARTVALKDERAGKLVAFCDALFEGPELLDPKWLKENQLDAAVKNNLRLYWGRWLVRQRFYDESLEQFAGLKPEDVIDPAALLFYQSV
ncbi:MAG: hypothetical protein N2C14_23115, partial [Planctomycetales bacterium]